MSSCHPCILCPPRLPLSLPFSFPSTLSPSPSGLHIWLMTIQRVLQYPLLPSPATPYLPYLHPLRILMNLPSVCFSASPKRPCKKKTGTALSKELLLFSPSPILHPYGCQALPRLHPLLFHVWKHLTGRCYNQWGAQHLHSSLRSICRSQSWCDCKTLASDPVSCSERTCKVIKTHMFH